MDVGALTPPLWGFEEREKLMVFYERASRRADARQLLPSRRRPPGPAAGRWSTTSPTGATSFPQVCDDIESLVTENRIFKQRNVDIGVVTEEEASRLGLLGRDGARLGPRLGPARAQPYECYDELEFDIPLGKNGDCYDRYLCRIEEMRESIRDHEAVHATSCARRRRPVLPEDNKIAPPRRGEMKRSMEALIHHFKLYTEGFHVPAGEVYACVEAPKGEFGVYLVSDGTNKPYRVQDPRAGLPAPAGDGLDEPRPHAGRRVAPSWARSTSCSGRVDR